MTAITAAPPSTGPSSDPSGDPTTDPSGGSAAGALLALAHLVDARDWEGLRAHLSEGLVVTFAVDGRTFDRDGFVAFQRDYPGVWRFIVEDLVDAGDRAVIRSVIRPADGGGATSQVTFHAASFARVDARGAIVELTELWADGPDA